MKKRIFSDKQKTHLPLFFNEIMIEEMKCVSKDSNKRLLSAQTGSFAIIERPMKRISNIINFEEVD